MDELGQILQQARENKGLTVQQAQEETRINARFLAALESGDYKQLPTPVHVRGFLRNYARFLGLDPAPLLERYQPDNFQTQSANTIAVVDQGNPPTAEHPLASRTDQPFFSPVNMTVENGQRGSGELIVRLVIIVAAIAALGLIAARFVPMLRGEGDGSEAITAGITDFVDRTLNGEDAASSDTAVSPTAATGFTTTDIITSTSRNQSGMTFETPAAQPTTTRPILPPTLDEIRLRLDIDERTWMEVTIDGDVVFSGIARPNDTFEWTAVDEVKLLTGNAIGIFATINEDIIIGRLGGRGENKEEVWRTTN